MSFAGPLPSSSIHAPNFFTFFFVGENMLFPCSPLFFDNRLSWPLVYVLLSRSWTLSFIVVDCIFFLSSFFFFAQASCCPLFAFPSYFHSSILFFSYSFPSQSQSISTLFPSFIVHAPVLIFFIPYPRPSNLLHKSIAHILLLVFLDVGGLVTPLPYRGKGGGWVHAGRCPHYSTSKLLIYLVCPSGCDPRVLLSSDMEELVTQIPWIGRVRGAGRRGNVYQDYNIFVTHLSFVSFRLWYSTPNIGQHGRIGGSSILKKSRCLGMWWRLLYI